MGTYHDNQPIYEQFSPWLMSDSILHTYYPNILQTVDFPGTKISAFLPNAVIYDYTNQVYVEGEEQKIGKKLQFLEAIKLHQVARLQSVFTTIDFTQTVEYEQDDAIHSVDVANRFPLEDHMKSLCDYDRAKNEDAWSGRSWQIGYTFEFPYQYKKYTQKCSYSHDRRYYAIIVVDYNSYTLNNQFSAFAERGLNISLETGKTEVDALNYRKELKGVYFLGSEDYGSLSRHKYLMAFESHTIYSATATWHEYVEGGLIPGTQNMVQTPVEDNPGFSPPEEYTIEKIRKDGSLVDIETVTPGQTALIVASLTENLPLDRNIYSKRINLLKDLDDRIDEI